MTTKVSNSEINHICLRRLMGRQPGEPLYAGCSPISSARLLASRRRRPQSSRVATVAQQHRGLALLATLLLARL